MGLGAEFKEFAMKGNVVDLAVGVIIGAAFGKIVSSLVGDIFMPTLGKVIGGINFSEFGGRAGQGPDGQGGADQVRRLPQTMFDFVIIALVLFLVIKGINNSRGRPLPRRRRLRRRLGRRSFSRKFATCSRSAAEPQVGIASRPTAYARRFLQRSDNMGMFDGLLGGVVGAEMATVVNGLIEKHGGIQGIVAQLEQQGLGGTVRSWVGTGANQPITAEQIHQAFGSDTVKQLAAKIGMTPEELAAKLSQDPAAGHRQAHTGWRSRKPDDGDPPRRRGSRPSSHAANTSNAAPAPAAICKRLPRIAWYPHARITPNPPRPRT